MMQAAGYQATGVDPEAPLGSSYRQVEFERYAVPGQLDAIVACTSLHHVADLPAVLDWAAQALVPGGRAVIVEWARERFDEATARWCFARLPGPGDDPGWLHRRQAEWRESGWPWDACLESWVDAEGLHAGQDILDELDARFDCQAVAWGPYFFADLAGTTDADEQAAIDSGLIQANRIQYVGRRGDSTQGHSMPGPVPPSAPRVRQTWRAGFPGTPAGHHSRIGSRAAYWPRARPGGRPAVPPDAAGGEVAGTALRLDARHASRR